MLRRFLIQFCIVFAVISGAILHEPLIAQASSQKIRKKRTTRKRSVKKNRRKRRAGNRAAKRIVKKKASRRRVKVKRRRGKRRRRRPRYRGPNIDGVAYRITVQRRQSLWSIAKRYRVTVKQIRRWNRLRSNRLRPKQRLVIYSTKRFRMRRKGVYVIQRGDTLAKIAKRLRVSVRELRRRNRLRRHLRIGRRLVYTRVGPEKPSHSVGKPSRGRLRNGERLPNGYGYIVRRPLKSYGTNETISHVIHCVRMLKRRYRSAPTIMIGNLSRNGGGRLRPHKSHRSGRDADIAYYYKEHNGKCVLKNVNTRTIDARKSWYLISCFLKTRDVKSIYIDYRLQKPLYQVARRYLGKGQLAKIFQYPRGRGRDAVIKHSRGHVHHFHVRFKCPEGDNLCVN